MTQTPAQEQQPAAVENAPEDLKRMVAPGQEDLLAEFLKEKGIEDTPPEQAQADRDSELILGKFKSVEDLAKSYKELEQRLGQPKQDAPPEPEIDPSTYTPEVGREQYGSIAEVFEAAEVNPLEMSAALQKGEDVSKYVDAIVEKGGIPKAVVDTYLQGLRPSEPQQQGFTEEQQQQLLQLVGGQEQFQQMASWARKSMSPQDVADLNEALASGNAAAARLAMRQLNAAYSSREVEPALIGGGGTPRGETFADMREATAARFALDDQGRVKYETDSQYRNWYEEKLLRSNV